MPDVNSFFEGQPVARGLFDSVWGRIELLGSVEIRVTKSQIAFRRKRGFAWVWMPGQYLRREAAPLVLSIALRRRDTWPRWKEVVEPYPGRFMHHLELFSTADLNDEILPLLAEAWNLAG